MSEAVSEAAVMRAELHPWGRFLAKWIDAYLGGFALGYLVGSTITREQFFLVVLVMALYPALEGVTIAALGTTPGKAAFRISVLDEDGQKLRLGPSVRRSYAAALQGYAFGIPLISLFAMLGAYDHLKKTGGTTWDRAAHVLYRNDGPQWFSWAALVVVVTFYVAVTVAQQA